MNKGLNVILEASATHRRELQKRLTAALPQWFGQPNANAKYALQPEVLDGFVGERDGVRCGLLLLKYHSPTGAEIYCMGVDPASHRSGIGRALVQAAMEKASRRGVRYLFVATLHRDVQYEPFERTRRFYAAMGFAYVHEEHLPVDPENPIAYYLRQL